MGFLKPLEKVFRYQKKTNSDNEKKDLDKNILNLMLNESQSRQNLNLILPEAWQP